MAVNFDGAFYCCRALIPGMIANNYGRIINTASGTSSHMQSWADCITGTHVSSFWKRQG
jgi:NAD(P)-dependent dehydrogenase (short-subunit alcohol dehydrogenase family)